MQDFVKKNGGKVMHVKVHEGREIRCYFSVSSENFDDHEWIRYVSQIMKPYIVGIPSFIEMKPRK